MSDLRKDAQIGTLRDDQVKAMFNRVAGGYDRLNSVMSAGLHHGWRERAVQLTRVRPGMSALDVATGTGDLAIALAAQGAAVTGADFSQGMLDLARRKAPALRWELADACGLPYDDDTYDVATAGFGVRNFADLDAGLREMVRVVRPGGRIVVLEMTTPTRPPLSTFFRLWFDRVIPMLGRIDEAYAYLPASVRRFPNAQALAGRLAAAGLTDVRWLLTGGGIIAIHHGTVA